MEKFNEDKEFDLLTSSVLNHEEFKKTKDVMHHGISRYTHLLRVSYYTYKVTKLLRLNYEEATRAALLHDFFIDETDTDNSVQSLRRHPEYALQRASKYFELSDLEEDIIKTHMFPVTFTPPKYLESWIVDLVDDFAGIYEKTYSVRREIKAASTFLFLLVVNYIRFK